ncbi:hypothetical protein E2C01_039543 [Portunus trituberculatus]|uniref:Uncharacterized protein n=1 Tax=Portunus trituberculatus TaxID=210409 RepID=A0A5B7FJY3_PORTR|nr:hypothetical protein [Portunus trituberculatus]
MDSSSGIPNVMKKRRKDVRRWERVVLLGRWSTSTPPIDVDYVGVRPPGGTVHGLPGPVEHGVSILVPSAEVIEYDLAEGSWYDKVWEGFVMYITMSLWQERWCCILKYSQRAAGLLPCCPGTYAVPKGFLDTAIV